MSSRRSRLAVVHFTLCSHVPAFSSYYDRFFFSLGSIFFFPQFVQIAAIYILHANLNGLVRLASIIYDRVQKSVFGIL